MAFNDLFMAYHGMAPSHGSSWNGQASHGPQGNMAPLVHGTMAAWVSLRSSTLPGVLDQAGGDPQIMLHCHTIVAMSASAVAGVV